MQLKLTVVLKKKNCKKKTWVPKKHSKRFFFKYSFKRDYKLTVAYIGKVVTDVIEV